MEIKDRVCVVTGGARGIGEAICAELVAEGAKHVVVADRDLDIARQVADRIGAQAMEVDVSQEKDISRLVASIDGEFGGIDLFVSNAGILLEGGLDVPTSDWQRIWEINVMSHVWAARHVVPGMIARGGGYLLNTASAAGLLNQVGAMPYGVTKHAAVGVAEWLSLTYGDQGIGVSCLCPQAVRTDMIAGHEDGVASLDGVIEPQDVAKACIEAIRKEEFLVLPHPKVKEYMQLKTADYDRWLAGMRKLNQTFGG